MQVYISSVRLILEDILVTFYGRNDIIKMSKFFLFNIIFSTLDDG